MLHTHPACRQCHENSLNVANVSLAHGLAVHEMTKAQIHAPTQAQTQTQTQAHNTDTHTGTDRGTHPGTGTDTCGAHGSRTDLQVEGFETCIPFMQPLHACQEQHLQHLATFRQNLFACLQGFPAESFEYILLDAPCSALGLRPRLTHHTTMAELRQVLHVAIALCACLAMYKVAPSTV